MTRAREAYALRCPGQCSEEKNAFGCNVRPPLDWEFLAARTRFLGRSTT